MAFYTTEIIQEQYRIQPIFTNRPLLAQYDYIELQGSPHNLIQKSESDSQIEALSKYEQKDDNPWVHNLSQEHCLICLQKVQNPQMEAVPSCGHKFCKTCLNAHIKISMQSCKIAKCPLQGCNQIVTSSSPFLKYLTPQQQKRYAHIQKYLRHIDNQDTRICPKEDCEGVCNIKINPTECTICNESLCSICMNKYHDGDCDQNGIKFLIENYSFKQCAQCKMLLEKNDGCPHMTCKCGYQFCYLCGSEWILKHSCRGMIADLNVQYVAQLNVQHQLEDLQQTVNRFQHEIPIPLPIPAPTRRQVICRKTVRFVSFIVIAIIMISFLPFDLIAFTIIRTIRGSVKMLESYKWHQILIGNIFLLVLTIIQTTWNQLVQCECEEVIKYFQPVSYKLIKAYQEIIMPYI